MVRAWELTPENEERRCSSLPMMVEEAGMLNGSSRPEWAGTGDPPCRSWGCTCYPPTPSPQALAKPTELAVETMEETPLLREPESVVHGHFRLRAGPVQRGRVGKGHPP